MSERELRPATGVAAHYAQIPLKEASVYSGATAQYILADVLLKPFALSVAFAVLYLLVISACSGDTPLTPTPSPESTSTPSPELTPSASPNSPELTPLPSPEATEATSLPPGCTVPGLISDLNFGRDRSEFALGEPVTMTVTFTNCGDQPVRLFYSTNQRYEFVVENLQDQEVWLWSSNKDFTQADQEESIATGEEVVYTEVWDQRNDDGQQVDPGRYQIFGFGIGCADEGAAASGCRFGPGLLIEITP